MGVARVIYRPEPGDVPRAAYGSIVTEAWRKATAANFTALLGAGWSRLESWGGIWGVGAAHELRLYYRRAPAQFAEIEADVSASLPGSRERQQVDVVVQGQTLATWEFSRDRNWGMRPRASRRR
jgi:hypothetical protein